MAHTPGPWTSGMGGNVNNSNGDMVAVVQTYHQTDNEIQANARLIAAAPLLRVGVN